MNMKGNPKSEKLVVSILLYLIHDLDGNLSIQGQDNIRAFAIN